MPWLVVCIPVDIANCKSECFVEQEGDFQRRTKDAHSWLLADSEPPTQYAKKVGMVTNGNPFICRGEVGRT